jgi:hypothetical protein
VVALRRHALLLLDDHHSASDALVAASLAQAPRNPAIAAGRSEASPKRKFKAYPIGFFHVNIAEVRTAQGKLYLFVAIDRASKFAVARLVDKANMPDRARLVATVPHWIEIVLNPTMESSSPIRQGTDLVPPLSSAAILSIARVASTGSGSSAHQAPIILGPRRGRTDEPDDEGRRHQAISPPILSPPTTSLGDRRPSTAFSPDEFVCKRRTNRAGPIHTETRSKKCRD